VPDFLGMAATQEGALEALTMAASLAVSLLCGLLLGWLYRRTYRGPSYSVTFDRALVTLTVITSIVIMVIGNNLARAFGLVGAMSIIRFRTAVKDTQDLVFIFFALTVGLAAGVGLYALALGGTLFVGAIISVLTRMNYGSVEERELVVQLRCAVAAGGPEPGALYSPILNRFCRQFNLVGARSVSEEGALDLTFYARPREPGSTHALTAELAALPQVNRVNVFYDEEPL